MATSSSSVICSLARATGAISHTSRCATRRALWATDGCIWVPPEGGDHAPRVYYGTTSGGLAADVAALLLRFGITARTYRVSQDTSTGYAVSVSGSDQQRRFLEHVGSFGPRRVPAERLARLLARARANTNVDTLPDRKSVV